MITTELGELTFIDQLLAVLNDGPATTEEIVAQAGTVICACPLCGGVPRPARPNETLVFLNRLLRAGRLTGRIVPVPGGELCAECGQHEQMTILWQRTKVEDDG